MGPIGKYLEICVLIGLVACGSPEPETVVTKPAEAVPEVPSGPKLFTLLTLDKTGIAFTNTVPVGANNNHFQDPLYYHGGGVSAGDINNDGLPDLFFTGNRVPNKLYLNKGGLKFEDITDIANIKENFGWTNGVTMADVNDDGYLDIYVCRGSGLMPEDIAEHMNSRPK